MTTHRKRLLELGPDGKTPVFQYTNAANTCIAATFERIRREMAEANTKPANIRRMDERAGRRKA